MISATEAKTNLMTNSFDPIALSDAKEDHDYYDLAKNVSVARDSKTALSEDKTSKKDIDKMAWGMASKGKNARSIIFDAYLDNLIIRLEVLDRNLELSDVKDIIATSQSYLRTLSRDPVSRLFIGTIVMSFRNNFQSLNISNVNSIARAVRKFRDSNKDINCYRTFLRSLHALNMSSLRSQE